MTIENSLERIATALETLAANAGETTAPVAAATPVAAAPEAKKTRAAKAAKVEAPVAPVVEEADPFALGTATPPKEVTLADVRTALIEYQKTSGSPEKARALLKSVGGVDALASLPAEKFAAVIAATQK